MRGTFSIRLFRQLRINARVIARAFLARKVLVGDRFGNLTTYLFYLCEVMLIYKFYSSVERDEQMRQTLPQRKTQSGETTF